PPHVDLPPRIQRRVALRPIEIRATRRLREAEQRARQFEHIAIAVKYVALNGVMIDAVSFALGGVVRFWLRARVWLDDCCETVLRRDDCSVCLHWWRLLCGLSVWYRLARARIAAHCWRWRASARCSTRA